MGGKDAGKTQGENEKEIRRLVRRSYYNKDEAKQYYEDNKEKALKRSKDKWANMSVTDKKQYYKARKLKRRKLKDVNN